MLRFLISHYFVDIAREGDLVRFEFHNRDGHQSTVRIDANVLREALRSDERYQDEEQGFAMFRPERNTLLRLVWKRKGGRVPVLLHEGEVEKLKELVA